MDLGPFIGCVYRKLLLFNGPGSVMTGFIAIFGVRATPRGVFTMQMNPRVFDGALYWGRLSGGHIKFKSRSEAIKYGNTASYSSHLRSVCLILSRTFVGGCDCIQISSSNNITSKRQSNSFGA
jgi:hypothetical protein